MREEIEEAFKEAQKSIKGSILMGNDPELKLQKVPFEIPTLDRILKGGLKKKGIHIFTGSFSTCKSFLAQKAIASIQKQGGGALLIDTESRYDPEWFKLTGVDTDNLIVLNPSYGEEGIDIAINFLKAKIDLIVFDSFAALVPLEESEEDMEHKFMGLQARMLNKAMRKIVPENKGSIIIATNQTRADIGNPYHSGVMENLVGGKGQYYGASLIMQTRRKGWLLQTKDGKIVEDEKAAKKANKVGFVVECFVQKCNYAPPFTSCEIPFNFYKGALDNTTSIIDLAVDEGKILQKGPWYKYKEEKFMGRQAVVDYFDKEENKDEFENLKKDILDV
jgi:recombination protein RecA